MKSHVFGWTLGKWWPPSHIRINSTGNSHLTIPSDPSGQQYVAIQIDWSTRDAAAALALKSNKNRRIKTHLSWFSHNQERRRCDPLFKSINRINKSCSARNQVIVDHSSAQLSQCNCQLADVSTNMICFSPASIGSTQLAHLCIICCCCLGQISFERVQKMHQPRGRKRKRSTVSPNSGSARIGQRMW